uniref:Uncharacterized protein n=1 Tax=Salix viminalis TaxID=40686 RepID=A0A6N2LZR5_SALVM
MKLSSVSPLRWLTITPQPAALESSAALMDSVTVPIWLTCNSKPLQAFFCIASAILFGFVTNKSSPTSWISTEDCSEAHEFQSSWSKGSSIDTIGNSLINSLYRSPRLWAEST